MISIIVPCYNTPKKYLIKCLESIQNQTNQDFECIIVDDCSSSTTTSKFVKKWALNNPKFKLIKNKKNVGLGPTRNVGIKNATGEIIIFVDSDDYLAFNALQDIKDIFNKYSDIDFYWFSFYAVTPEKKYYFDESWPSLPSPTKANDFNLISRISKMAWLKAYKKDFLINNSIYFVEENLYSEDTFYNIACLSKANSFIVRNTKNYFYSAGVEGSITSNGFSVKKAEDLLRNFIKAYEFIKNDNSLLSNNYAMFFNYSFYKELQQFKILKGNKEFESVFNKSEEFLSSLKK